MRKSEVVTVPSEWGARDAGKHFLITEWDAFRAEKWAWRATLLLKGSTAQIPLDVARLGMVGVAVRLINAVLAADVDPDKMEKLLAEMMTCVQMVREPGTKDPLTGLPLGTPIGAGQDDIEEVRTILWLRSEVARIHTGFMPAAALSELLSALAESKEASSTT